MWYSGLHLGSHQALIYHRPYINVWSLRLLNIQRGFISTLKSRILSMTCIPTCLVNKHSKYVRKLLNNIWPMQQISKHQSEISIPTNTRYLIKNRASRTIANYLQTILTLSKVWSKFIMFLLNNTVKLLREFVLSPNGGPSCPPPLI